MPLYFVFIFRTYINLIFANRYLKKNDADGEKALGKSRVRVRGEPVPGPQGHWAAADHVRSQDGHGAAHGQHPPLQEELQVPKSLLPIGTVPTVPVGKW